MAVIRRTLRTNPFCRASNWSYTGHKGLGRHIFDNNTPPVHIEGCFTADCSIKQVVEPVILLMLKGAPNNTFQQDNAKPHVSRWTIGSLTRFDILSWLVNSPDLKPTEHILVLTGMICAQQ
ncbi:hypothetical protein TNCV_4330581 [Trichonephila clavipes]|nr:hypothetical protein TNCV_4330581 [Trichonephila clavipes]